MRNIYIILIILVVLLPFLVLAFTLDNPTLTTPTLPEEKKKEDYEYPTALGVNQDCTYGWNPEFLLCNPTYLDGLLVYLK